MRLASARIVKRRSGRPSHGPPGPRRGTASPPPTGSGDHGGFLGGFAAVLWAIRFHDLVEPLPARSDIALPFAPAFPVPARRKDRPRLRLHAAPIPGGAHAELVADLVGQVAD